MGSSLERLEAKRRDFHVYSKSVVQPLLALSAKEMDKLDFVEVAKRIGNIDIKTRYSELVIAVLEEDIAHYEPDTTAFSIPKHSNTGIVVSTLIIAAIAHYHSGATVALTAAALWYWFASEVPRRRNAQLAKDARSHNELVADWKGTLEEWRVACQELRSL